MLSLVPDSKLLILKNRHAQEVTLLPPLLPFAFLAQFFFSFPGHLLGFILVGKAMVKNFSIRELVWRKSWSVVEQDLHSNFHVNLTFFFFFFVFLWPVWLNHAHLGIVWEVPTPLFKTVNTDDVTSGTRDVDRYEPDDSGVNGWIWMANATRGGWVGVQTGWVLKGTTRPPVEWEKKKEKEKCTLFECQCI